MRIISADGAETHVSPPEAFFLIVTCAVFLDAFLRSRNASSEVTVSCRDGHPDAASTTIPAVEASDVSAAAAAATAAVAIVVTATAPFVACLGVVRSSEQSADHSVSARARSA